MKRWGLLVVLVVLVGYLVFLPKKNPPQPPAPERVPPTVSKPGPHGRFEGQIVTNWNEDGRTMTLLEDFTYYDSKGKRWSAPKGAIVDGASIPASLWSYVGGPYTSKYRIASVIHDVACDLKKENWEEVHRMFYNACLCAGLGETRAKLMYWAVYQGGPRWGADKKEIKTAPAEEGPFLAEAAEKAPAEAKTRAKMAAPRRLMYKMAPAPGPPRIDQQSLEEMERLIESGDLSLEELERTPTPSMPQL